MRNLKVGEEVVALSNNPNEIGVQLRVKGKTYTVLDAVFCKKCGIQSIHIGTGVYGLPTGSAIRSTICLCGHVEPNAGGQGWTRSVHFAPIDDLHDVLAKAVEEEDYELAVVLRDTMAEKEVPA